MDLTALLAELCAVPAPTGAETELADLLQDRWTPRCAEVRRDGVGNVVARVGGSGPRVLVQAHMDQIGYVVRHITDEGFLLLDGAQGDRRNGPERRHHVGQPVRALARDGSWVEGLLAAASGHVLTAEQREEHRIGYDDFWVELGLRDRRRSSRWACTPARRCLLRRDARDRAAAGRAEHGQPRRARAMDALLQTSPRRSCTASCGSRRRSRRRTACTAPGRSPATTLGRGGRARRRTRRRRPRVSERRARDPPGRRPDRRPPRHGDHLRPPADMHLLDLARATTCPRRTGCSRATAPTAWRSGSRARRRRC